MAVKDVESAVVSEIFVRILDIGKLRYLTSWQSLGETHVTLESWHGKLQYKIFAAGITSANGLTLPETPVPWLPYYTDRPLSSDDVTFTFSFAHGLFCFQWKWSHRCEMVGYNAGQYRPKIKCFENSYLNKRGTATGPHRDSSWAHHRCKGPFWNRQMVGLHAFSTWLWKCRCGHYIHTNGYFWINMFL